MRLKDKVAVITGAGSGIGKAIAHRFAAEGANVVCASVSGRAVEVAGEIGPAAVGVQADVGDEADVRRLMTTAHDAFGRIDVLVNNAGFGGKLRPLHEQTTADWDRVHGVNLRGVFFCMKYGIIAMRGAGGGSIVNISSATAVVGFKNHGVYGAAKAGVNQLTKAAALDYADDNIRVNAVCPGTIWTGLVAMSKVSPEPPPGVYRLPGIPMDRWGLSDEVAAAALFLASDEASYVTGLLMPVDGGYSIGYSGMGAEKTGKPTA
ncbi:SDR family oxidoreductase [Frankia sp. AgB1.9]|uniref:SDR family NAD(P)-dependent oxidoreductase n=1 Tax=unclassified Frankia TaxID=2632575 RepID=UPI0019331BFF|nr:MULTISPECIES: SDR family oxidoreductase [unclassified Frankia]MBL7488815.1 SDR family oxidoreductase [Frankia sp. AgW1.1]MBL7546458.1 SDR family oxidoreductase [Frankia sp. AgB1.9]MBL7620283.1 SDR family oxidoreductase [Frankia sp. AgB1.8]